LNDSLSVYINDDQSIKSKLLLLGELLTYKSYGVVKLLLAEVVILLEGFNTTFGTSFLNITCPVNLRSI
jgi:hypothetical protein